MKMRLFLFILIFFVISCSNHLIINNGGKITVYLKNDRQVRFHYSIDNYLPHEMIFENGRYKFQLDRIREFRYFFTDENGFIPVECILREFDDYGNYNCIYEL